MEPQEVIHLIGNHMLIGILIGSLVGGSFAVGYVIGKFSRR